MIKLLVARSFGLLLSLIPIKEVQNSNVSNLDRKFSLPEVVITAKAIKKTIKTTSVKEFLGYSCEQPLDGRVHSSLKEALNEYSGPELVFTSLRRHRNNGSKHNVGKAADVRFDKNVIDWLISEEGSAWRTKFGITFYIEDKPGSRLLKPFKADSLYSKYVLENPYATGDHIHINI